MQPSRDDAPVAGVVLAAGASERMGRNKLFLELGGETVLRRTVRFALAAGLNPVIVVLRGDVERTHESLEGLAFTPVVNPEPHRGINRSVRLGVEAVPGEAAAAVVLLADMPFVTEGMIRTVVRSYRRSGTPLVVSRYGDVHAPPTLYDRSLFSEFDGPDGDGCGRSIVRRHLAEAAVIDCPEEALADLDVPEDYERARARLNVG